MALSGASMNRLPGTDRGRGNQGGDVRIFGSAVGIYGLTLQCVTSFVGCIRQASVMEELVGNTMSIVSS